MNTKEIYQNIKETIGFEFFRLKTFNEWLYWIVSNYNCSKYISKKVADLLMDEMHPDRIKEWIFE